MTDHDAYSDGGSTVVSETQRRRFLQAIGAAAVGAGAVGSASAQERDEDDGEETDAIELTHGVASGSVRSRSAVVWARAASAGTLHVQFAPERAEGRGTAESAANATKTDATKTDATETNATAQANPTAKGNASSASENPRSRGGNGRDGNRRNANEGGDRGWDDDDGDGWGGDDGDDGGWGDWGGDDGDENADDGEGRPGRGVGPVRQAHTEVTEETDFTGKLRLDGLRPGTRYHYRVWATEGRGRGPAPSDATVGSFVTAPAEHEDGGVSFAWSGDTWGYGDDPIEPPYPGLKTIADRQPDFFLYHGDTIYADAQTPAGRVDAETPLDEALDIYRGKYKEMRDPPSSVTDDGHLADLLATTSVYAMWDDHEVINNFDGSVSPLMPKGRRAFFEYWPIEEGSRGRDRGRGHDGDRDGNRLYRSFRWGAHLELFVVDTRQYRDPNLDLEAKELLGREQLEWLKTSMADSDATWKVIASPAPMGAPSDTWATVNDVTGYEATLLEVVKHVEREGISNVVSLAGDVHHSQVGGYDTDDDGEFELYEAIAGPLGAPAGQPGELYDPMHPTEFFAKGDYFNFGQIDVSPDGETLTIGIYAEDGTEQFSKELTASEARPTEVPDRIESTFDSDADGWLVSQNGGSNTPEYFQNGGKSGGCIGDEENRGGIAWYYQAPFEYLGDREAFYGGTLAFDLRQESDDQQFDAALVEGGDVALTSGEVTLVYDVRGVDANPGTDWTHYEIRLTAEEPWVNLESQEPLATEEEFRAVLGDLEQLRIRGEYRSGGDASRLDNVVLSR